MENLYTPCSTTTTTTTTAMNNLEQPNMGYVQEPKQTQRVLLKKELTNSDVGFTGRIILPKREAEKNFPTLTETQKEGIQIVLRDACSDKTWGLQFKYWSNNNSRMYILRDTGKFVKDNRMEIGDSLILWEDESKNVYFSIEKVEKPGVVEPLNQQQHYTNHNTSTPISYEARDEEEASRAQPIEQLSHKEQQEMDAWFNYDDFCEP